MLICTCWLCRATNRRTTADGLSRCSGCAALQTGGLQQTGFLGVLVVPRYKQEDYNRRAFSVFWLCRATNRRTTADGLSWCSGCAALQTGGLQQTGFLGVLVVPRYKQEDYSRRAFSVCRLCRATNRRTTDDGLSRCSDRRYGTLIQFTCDKQIRCANLRTY